VNLSFSEEEVAFAEEARTWLESHLVGEYAQLRGRGGTGREDVAPELLIAWEREMASGGWLGLDYPKEFGGREASLFEQVLFHQEYVEARAPGRIPNIGLTLLGPTLLTFGTPSQQRRFIPKILSGKQFWCQGYSEPNAGSDLAGISTRAELRGGCWYVSGQKTWTSLARYAQWMFLLARTSSEDESHRGLSCILLPMEQSGVAIKPIVQLTGGSEFSEVFFDEAETEADLVVGAVGEGWKVAIGTLGFERGVATLGQQTSFRQELDSLLRLARQNGVDQNPVIRQELARMSSELQIMRWNNLRILSAVDSGGAPGPEMSIGKLFWAKWHRRLGELGIRIRGTSGMVSDTVENSATALQAGSAELDYRLDDLQRTFLYSRSHTIYAGTNEIQRNVIGERVLGLPKEPR